MWAAFPSSGSSDAFPHLHNLLSMTHLGVRLATIVVILTAALLPRVLNLGAFLTVDEEQWHRNTVGFRDALQHGDFGGLYQQHHPGVTTMWLASLTVTADSWATRLLPAALALGVLVGLAWFLMMRLWGWKTATFAALLLALNPLFIAHSRVLAMDALQAVFMALSALGALVWIEQRKPRWLIFSGAMTALAILSKFPAVVLLPWFALVLVVDFATQRLPRETGRAALLWGGSLFLTLLIVFPTILTNPQTIADGIAIFFREEQYQYRIVHGLGPWWYFQTLLLWSTPIHVLAFVLLPFAVLASDTQYRRALGWLGALGILYFLGMEFSIKKGDRYLLPDFLLIDLLATLVLGGIVYGLSPRPLLTSRARNVVLAIAVLLLGYQVVEILRLHPYALAYRNPLFRSIAAGRTMGWGEGLDLAAEYLNAKPNAEKLLVISYWEGPFQYRFRGQVTSAERLAQETVQEIGGEYVVLYRAMEGRASSRWETKVLLAFRDQTPEHVIVLNQEPYAWIYAVSDRARSLRPTDDRSE